MFEIRETPYTAEEKRVCDYLQKIIPDIGCGNDPIGFLIASHSALRVSQSALKQQLAIAVRDLEDTRRDLKKYKKAYSNASWAAEAARDSYPRNDWGD